MEGPSKIDILIERDDSLFGDIAAIDFEDGYEFKGFWLQCHLMVWAASCLSAAHPDVPNLKIVKMRAGSTAHRILTSTSIVVPEDDEIRQVIKASEEEVEAMLEADETTTAPV